MWNQWILGYPVKVLHAIQSLDLPTMFNEFGEHLCDEPFVFSFTTFAAHVSPSRMDGRPCIGPVPEGTRLWWSTW